MPGQSQLTETTRNALREKLDGIVSKMVANGEPDTNIQTVVDDFKERYMLAAPPSAPDPSWLDLAATGAGQTLKSLVAAPFHLAQTVLTSTPESLGHAIVDPSVDQWNKSRAAFGQGRISEGLGHLAGTVPLIGPAVASIGERIGTGDPLTMAEGVGDAGALLLAGPTTRAAGRVASAAGRTAQNVGRNAWLRAAKPPEFLAKQTNAYRRTGELAAGDEQLAETVLSQGRGALTRKNASALTQQARTAGRDVNRLATTGREAMPSGDILHAVDRAIARMRAAERPESEIAAAVARRNALAENWTVQRRSARTEPAGPVTIDPDTAQLVREGQVQGYVDMVNRPTMRQAEAPHRTPYGGPGETFEQVYPSRPPAAQDALNEMRAVPDPVRLGGQAGEYAPIRSVQTTTTTQRPLSARKVQQMKLSARGADPVNRAIRSTAAEWQDASIPGLADAKTSYAALRPAAAAAQKGHRAATQRPQPVSAMQLVSPLHIVQRSGPLSRVAQGTYTLGSAAQRAARLAPAAGRAAFPTALFGQVADDDPEQAELARQLVIAQLMASH